MLPEASLAHEIKSASHTHSAEQRSAVPVLLVVLCELSTSAPAAGMSGRKVDVKRLPPLWLYGVWLELEIGTSLQVRKVLRVTV